MSEEATVSPYIDFASGELVARLEQLRREPEATRPLRIQEIQQIELEIRRREIRELRGQLEALESQREAEAVRLCFEQQARARAEEANRLTDQYLAVVSHELRTPLNSILGWMDIVQSRTDDRAIIERATQVVRRSAGTLTRIVDDLLDISRIVTGKLRLQVSEADLGEVVRAAVDAVRPSALSNRLELRDAIATQCVVRGDATRLQQVVSNLLSNALKFTRPGGYVDVTLERREAWFRLTVRDDGCGISAEDLPHVFDRFRQADSSTRRSQRGLGLGLAIARHIVTAHGGWIDAHSEGRGKGTTVVMEVPAHPSPSSPPSRPSTRSIPSGPSSLSGVKVLLVDDDVSTAELDELALRDRGAIVRSADSVDAALELVRSFRPDVIVSDVGMSGRDGYDLIRAVRALPEPVAGVPAIAVTGYARVEDAEHALRAGFTRHVAKPTRPSQLAELIGELLERP